MCKATAERDGRPYAIKHTVGTRLLLAVRRACSDRQQRSPTGLMITRDDGDAAVPELERTSYVVAA